MTADRGSRLVRQAKQAPDEATYPLFRQAVSEIEIRIRRLLVMLDPLGQPFPETMEEAMPDEMVSIRYMVDDVGKAVAFYTGVLGFEVLNSFPAFADVARGRLRLLLSGPESSAARPMPDGARPGPGGWNRIHLIVDDIAAEVARLRDAGASFRNDILEGPGGKQILLNDPAGNVVEIFQPAAFGPARPVQAR
jgi:catechol 2,3-dioxygenase-like lactoylglutathione lyase family enzyme